MRKEVEKEIALLRACQIAGGRKQLAALIGATHDQIKHWINRGDNIPYDCAFLIVQACGGKVALSELCSEKKLANQLLNAFKQGSGLCWLPQSLVTLSNVPIETSCLNKPIVVDYDCRFITYATLLDIKGPPLPNLVSVIKIDIEDHLKTFTPIMNIAHYCLLSERIKVAPIIKKLLKEQRRKCPNLDILKIRSDEAIAKLLVLGGKTSYHHIIHVVTYGCDALIEAMDRGSKGGATS